MKDPAVDPHTTVTSKPSSSPTSRTSSSSTSTSLGLAAAAAVKSNNTSSATMSSSSSTPASSSRPTKRPASASMEKPKPSTSKDQPPVQASNTSTSAQPSAVNDKNRPRTLNRVPRACNACRKQKMRCEGADNPPCKRCRHAGYDCLFEKPVRDVTTSEQGMERIRNLETQVTGINNTLTELVSTLRAGHGFNYQAAPPPSGGVGATSNVPPALGATPYPQHPIPHQQQPPQGQQQQAIPGSPQTAADSPASSSGTQAQGPPSHTASAPSPSPRFGPEGVPAAGTVAGQPHGGGQQQVVAGQASVGGSTMSPLAIDTAEVGGVAGSGRAYDQQGASASSSSAAYMNGHGHPYGAPQGSAATHGGHGGSGYDDSHAHLYGQPSQSPAAMHHDGGGHVGHHPGSSSGREYANVPYSPADESVAGSPTAYRQGSIDAGAYPTPHHQQHQQYVQQQHQHHRHAQHMMGPPQNEQRLPPISTLPSLVQPYPPSSRNNNSAYQQQQRQYAQTPTTASTSRQYSSSTLSSGSSYSGTPQAAYQQQPYPHQRAPHGERTSYETSGGQASNQGQEYARPRRLPMHHDDLPTTANTSPLRRVIPPSPVAYSHSSHEHSSKPLNPAPRDMGSSGVTPADSDDEDIELTTEGLVAPFKVLRDLADWADTNGGASASHTRSPSPDPQSSRSLRASSSADVGVNGSTTAGTKRELHDQGGRRSKRRKMLPDPGGQLTTTPHGQVYSDVVTVGIIGEEEARELFDTFYHGCSTFLPVFDAKVDTYDALRRRSPFCVNAICMVAAKVQNGGGPESDTYKRILEEVQKIAMATMFSPVMRQEAVQATIIIAGWSTDGGWLSLGHAVRMAFEIGMHKTWPKLLKRIKAGKTSDDEEERTLVISTRTWFCLYLFEHQLSLGTGRPMILHEDESIKESQEFLRHPLAIPDDLRLVSMVQLGVIKERLHKDLAQVSSDTPSDVFTVLKNHRGQFDEWTRHWDAEFVKRGDEYPDCEFQRQSLEVQRMFAELFHNATALRGIRGPEDAGTTREEERLLAVRSIDLAKRGLETCLRSPNYRNGLKYAVHFTHVSATFAGSFLIRLARLFPDVVDLRKVMLDVEELILALSSIPARRYARTLRLMLTCARQRNVLPARSHPGGPVDGSENGAPPPAINSDHMMPQPDGLPLVNSTHSQSMDADNAAHHEQAQAHLMYANGMPPPYSGLRSPSSSIPQYETQVAFGYDQQSIEGATWISDAMLNDLTLSQYGLEAFVIPPWDNESHRNIPQIW